MKRNVFEGNASAKGTVRARDYLPYSHGFSFLAIAYDMIFNYSTGIPDFHP
jgi:hypothetical protein